MGPVAVVDVVAWRRTGCILGSHLSYKSWLVSIHISEHQMRLTDTGHSTASKGDKVTSRWTRGLLSVKQMAVKRIANKRIPHGLHRWAKAFEPAAQLNIHFTFDSGPCQAAMQREENMKHKRVLLGGCSLCIEGGVNYYGKYLSMIIIHSHTLSHTKDREGHDNVKINVHRLTIVVLLGSALLCDMGTWQNYMYIMVPSLSRFTQLIRSCAGVFTENIWHVLETDDKMTFSLDRFINRRPQVCGPFTLNINHNANKRSCILLKGYHDERSSSLEEQHTTGSVTRCNEAI